MTGRRFGKLVVIERAPSNRWKQSLWLCRCDCGTVHTVNGCALRRGAVQSCKCSWRTKGAENIRWRGYGGLSGAYWGALLRGAKGRGLEVTISIEEAWSLFLSQNERCALTGLPLKLGASWRSKTLEQTASFDRIDSDKGYIAGNVQWIHKALQQLKMSLPQETFIYWCRLVTAHAEGDRYECNQDNPDSESPAWHQAGKAWAQESHFERPPSLVEELSRSQGTPTATSSGLDKISH